MTSTERRYELLSGEVLAYPAPELLMSAFLERVEVMMRDPQQTMNDLIDVIYGTENPLLVQGVFKDRGMVTREVFDNPLYRVLTDMIERKRVLHHGLDRDAAAERYTMTTAQAAQQLGLSEGAVRAAVRARKIASVKRSGRLWLLPGSVEAYRPSRRGPGASDQLDVYLGSREGTAVRFEHDGHLTKRPKPEGWAKQAVCGVISGWTRGVVLSTLVREGKNGKYKTYRLFFIEPDRSADEQTVSHGEFFVKGRFKITRKINDSRKAYAQWKARGRSEKVDPVGA